MSYRIVDVSQWPEQGNLTEPAQELARSKQALLISLCPPSSTEVGTICKYVGMVRSINGCRTYLNRPHMSSAAFASSPDFAYMWDNSQISSIAMVAHHLSSVWRKKKQPAEKR